jgi:hypothetical protein
MATQLWQIALCESCQTYTKHTSQVTAETVTKTCLVCGRKFVSNRKQYAAKVESNKQGRKRHDNPRI